jgi:hypothetical protein
MTLLAMESLINFYSQRLEKLYPGEKPRQLTTSQMDHPSRGITHQDEVAHVKFMVEELRKSLVANRLQVTLRWLGFLEGYLWSRGLSTLQDLIQADEKAAR